MASPIENIFNDDPGSYCALVLIKSIFIDSLSPFSSAEINTSPVLAFAKTTEQLNASVFISASLHKFVAKYWSSESRVNIRSSPWIGWVVWIFACGIMVPFGAAS